jgi:hypothetical protein
MGQCGGDIDDSDGMIDGGRLDSSDLMLTQDLADNVEPAGERCISEDMFGRAFAAPPGS